MGEALGSVHPGPVGRGQRGEGGWQAREAPPHWPPGPVPAQLAHTHTGLAHTGFVSWGEPHLWSLTMRLETKSLASSDTASKVSSSKYQLPARTLFRVSVSSSPRKGERPLSLEGGVGREQGGEIGSGMGTEPRKQHHALKRPPASQMGQTWV